MNFTVVSTLRSEDPVVRAITEASVTVPEDMPAFLSPRMVLFEELEVDGQHLPVRTELPLGPYQSPQSVDQDVQPEAF